MPLVLTQNEVTESGHTYHDDLGVSYEYPTQYKNLIRAGERFVYYRGRRRREGGTQIQCYIGSGLIGLVGSGSADRLLRCQINDFKEFETPVPFKLAGEYLEEAASALGPNAGLHFRQGVRRLDETTFTRIISLARVGTLPQPPSETSGANQPLSSSYPPPTHARQVDDVAMEIALGAVAREFVGWTAERMPPNNPGFDIRLRRGSDTKYVEVKGTVSQKLRFFMSEGERCFAESNADSYALLVISQIDLNTRSGVPQFLVGDFASQLKSLRPTQWIAEVKPSDA